MLRSLAAVGGILIVLNGEPAQALNTKSWVSNAGSDTNSCTLSSPCASLEHASNQTVPGGEVGVLTPGDYGINSAVAFHITRSIHITNDGVGEASVLAGFDTPTAITIVAGVGDVVSLRGLVIDGQGSALTGIFVSIAAAVHIQNCVIRNFEGADAFAIEFLPKRDAQLFVTDTAIFNNGSTAASGGIQIAPGILGSARVVLDRVHLENNVIGLLLDGSASTVATSRVLVRDSVISGNAGNGIWTHTATGKSNALLVVERSTVMDNAGSGILADAPHATVLLSDTTITGNATGVNAVGGGQVISYGNNRNNNNIGAEGTATGFFSAF